MRGPNGGYVAAILMRAMQATVGDPGRAARSFTVHYLRPPVAGPIEVTTAVERAGKAMTAVSARLFQGDTLIAVALGAFSSSRAASEYAELTMPDVPAASSVPRATMEGAPPMLTMLDLRPVIGPAPFSGGEIAETGGWLRLLDAQTADAATLVAYSDAWMPAIFSRVGDRVGVPTVDLSVHFRVPVPLPDATADDHYLVVFRSPVAKDGFVVEDGEIWSKNGELVAQSRQLAAMLPIG